MCGEHLLTDKRYILNLHEKSTYSVQSKVPKPTHFPIINILKSFNTEITFPINGNNMNFRWNCLLNEDEML